MNSQENAGVFAVIFQPSRQGTCVAGPTAVATLIRNKPASRGRVRPAPIPDVAVDAGHI